MNSRMRWTFAITSLALFAFTLDRLVVAIALPAIRTDLGAQVADLEWTVNAYTLSFAVLLLTGGALGDRFGRRRMFTVGVAVFTAGSAAAALAPTIGALVAARAVQGVGGAVFTPLTLTMLSAVTPPGRRRVFAAGALAALAMYAALFGALFLITQLLQAGLGATPLQAGLRTLRMAVMPLLLAPAGGVITDRIGFRPLMICGLALEAVALGWLAAAVTPDVPYGLLVAPLALAGRGPRCSSRR